MLPVILASLELLLLSACQSPVVGIGKGRARGLDRAEQAWNVMQREAPGSAAGQQALKEYNEEVRAVVKALRGKEGSAEWGKTLSVANGGKMWRLALDEKRGDTAARTFSLAEFAHCQVAAEVKVHGFDRIVAHDGLGVPVVLKQDDPVRAQRPLHPPKGDFLPATAVLEFTEGDHREARLRFYDPMLVSEVQTGGRALTLAENLTAPMEFSLKDLMTDENGKERLAPSVSGEDESKLFFLNRYDRNKVPVVFVHGLRSGPVIWKNMVNALLADPELRRRYQPVCFVYPSGLPVPTSSARLRQLLKEGRAKLDPGHRDAGFNGVVLVGHSMGGLLARMQVIDSGSDFWRAFYTASPQKVGSELDAQTRKMVRSAMLFEHLPNVKTVIFITTPHQGSEIADIGIVQTVANIILALPKTAQRPFKALTKLPEADINPALRSFNEWGTTGVENLSTKHPYFKALAKRPILVPFHSVIGVGNAVDPANGTDGVVPYWSAHLKGAATEAVVPYPHGCVEREGTVREVAKVLRSL